MYSPTRRHGYRRGPGQKGRKKKVYFPLDFCSLYPIMEVMKGRNCYARFCDHPGLEKLLDFIEAKSSFLKPMSLPLSQREPFSLRTTAGLLTGHHACPLYRWPAVDLFFAGLIVRNGWLSRGAPPSAVLLLAGRCGFFLRCDAFHRPVTDVGLSPPGPHQCRLF